MSLRLYFQCELKYSYPKACENVLEAALLRTVRFLGNSKRECFENVHSERMRK